MFIRIGNRIINTDHVTDVEGDGCTVAVFLAPKEDGYQIIFTGEEASAVWAHFAREARDVVEFEHLDQQPASPVN